MLFVSLSRKNSALAKLFIFRALQASIDKFWIIFSVFESILAGIIILFLIEYFDS